MEPFLCELFVDYGGKLPSGCIQFDIRYGYGKQRERKKLYGNGGKEKLGFDIRFTYCGIAELYLKKLRIYDYFFLQSVQKKIMEELRVMVFPREKFINIRIWGAEEENQKENNDMTFMQMRNEEAYRIREYREGDLSKQIHWKLSARAEKALVREYDAQGENAAELFLDLRGYDAAHRKDKDAFYELLSALLLGLLRKKEKIRVCWYRGGRCDMEITESVQCRELLGILYRMDDRNGDEQTKEGGTLQPEMDAAGLILDMRLRLFQGKNLLCQFSGERLEEELQSRQIYIF